MPQRKDAFGVQYSFGEVDVAQAFAVGAASAQSAALNAATNAVTLTSTTACWAAIGANPTAVAGAGTGSFYVPANIPMSFSVNRGLTLKIAAIQAASGGFLSIVESA